MMEGKKPEIIPENIERQFNEIVKMSIYTNQFLSTQIPKYKVGSQVWVPKLQGETVEILKGIANVYLVRNIKGEYHICDEEDIKTVN